MRFQNVIISQIRFNTSQRGAYNQSPVVRRPIRANQGLNFNPGLFFFCSKEFSRIIFAIFFRPSNHQTVDKKNKTDFVFKL